MLETNPNYIGITLNRMIHNRNKSKLSFTRLSNFDGYNGLWNTSSIYRKKFLEIREFREDLPTSEDSEWSLFFLKNYPLIFPNTKESFIPHLYDAEAINLNNKINTKKRINEHISIAYYSNRKLLSLNAVLLHIKHVIIQLIKLRFFTQIERSDLAFNFFVIPRLIKARFKKPIFESRYF